MRRLGLMAAILAVTMFVVAGSAMAVPMNVRPVSPALTNLGSLQTFLDGKGQSIDVYNDQNGTAIWTTDVSENSEFTIMLEATAWAGTNKFGIYNDGDTGNLYEVFDGNAGVDWHATVSFNSGGTAGKLTVNLFNDFDVYQGASIYNNVNANAFGFYLDATEAGEPNSLLYFSEDDQNLNNTAQNLVYAATGTSSGQWWVTFEEQARWIGADSSDFTDFVILAESINPSPVPEPATMFLLGSGLIGLAGFGRKKLFKA